MNIADPWWKCVRGCNPQLVAVYNSGMRDPHLTAYHTFGRCQKGTVTLDVKEWRVTPPKPVHLHMVSETSQGRYREI